MKKNPHAVALGKLGGKKGGKAKFANMTDDEIVEYQRNAVKARWDKWRKRKRLEKSKVAS